MFKQNKRGEMTSQQIVMLIILIASFAVILFLLIRLNLGNESENELCHNSVVQKATLGEVGHSVPLNCKRSYVCLTEDGSCEAMHKPETIKVKTEEEVYEILANELADCWWMFGEGEINYVGSEIIPELYCSLCSQIAFDDSVKEIFKGEEFDKTYFYEFMKETNVGGSDLTYVQYLGIEEYVENPGADVGKINLNEQYFAMIGLTSDVSTLGWIAAVGSGAAVVVGGLALAPIAGSAGIVSSLIWSGGAGTVGATAGGLAVAPIIRSSFESDMIPPSLIEVGSEQYNALGCEDLTTSS